MVTAVFFSDFQAYFTQIMMKKLPKIIKKKVARALDKFFK